MYKIGDTSGLCDKTCDDQKHTIKVVGDIVPKLAKKCCDVPKKMRAPSKVIEITDGCFSSAQVVNVCDELGGGGDADSADAEANAADSACDGAASAGGGCGGGKSAKTCNKDACNAPTAKGGGGCGGKSSKASKTSKCTGEKLSDIKVPDAQDIMSSKGLKEALARQRDDESAFRHAYCELRPYPECATCPYATKQIKTTEIDVAGTFKQINDASQQLIRGDYELADNLFTCPGQLAALMSSELGPIAAVAGPRAVRALIELVALKGAINSYKNISRSAAGTDFRREVMYSVDKLLKAGSMVGLPDVFAREVSGILNDIGCSARDLTRLRARSGSARETRFGDDYSLWGSLGTGRSETDSVYRSGSRKQPSKSSITKAEKSLAECRVFLSGARLLEDDPFYAKQQGLNLPTSSKTNYTASTDTVTQQGKKYYKKDPVTGEFVELTNVPAGISFNDLNVLYGPIFVKADMGVSKDPPVKVDESETTVVEGRMYYYKDPKTGKNIQIDGLAKGASLSKEILMIAKKFGYLDGIDIDLDSLTTPEQFDEAIARLKNDSEHPDLKKKLDSLNISYSPYTLSTDSRANTVTTFLPVSPDEQNGYYVSNGKYIRYTGTFGASRRDSSATGDIPKLFRPESRSLPCESVFMYTQTTDFVPNPKKRYFAVYSEGDYQEINTENISTFEDLSYPVYERSLVPVVSSNYARRYAGSDPLVLDNGLVVSEPVFVDAASMRFAIDTQALQTKTLVNAGEMATIESLGLSNYEVTMSYLVDHLRNGSILPFDIRAEAISTVLDTICDDN